VSADTDNSFDALRDAILRGVAHAVSNRVAALGGIAGVVDPGQIWTEKMSHLLHGEAKRLEDILRLLRLIPSDERAPPGAIELQALIPDVVALHAFNSALLQVECVVAYDRETMPVFGNRPRLVHTLLLIVDAAKRHAHRTGGRVAIRYSGDAELVSIRVATEPASANVAIAPAPGESGVNLDATELALRSALKRVGGNPMIEASADGRQLCIALAVPTLAAGRRSERAAAGSPPVA
jgi:hypothetical protein